MYFGRHSFLDDGVLAFFRSYLEYWELLLVRRKLARNSFCSVLGIPPMCNLDMHSLVLRTDFRSIIPNGVSNDCESHPILPLVHFTGHD